jgi:hypothetical protein
MQIGRIDGATRVLGEAQGFIGLPVRDETMLCAATGQEQPVMVTAWLPTPKEIEALVAGAAVHIHIYGLMHPPIMVDVGALVIEALDA